MRYTINDDLIVSEQRYRNAISRSKTAKIRNIAAAVERKLQQLDNAATLEFLRSPPGNRLEQLTGDRVGQHSIRINDQFRLCFRWTARGPEDVEIVDYH